MNFMISMYSQVPIYEQLQNQIREAILKGTLQPNEQLPSIRVLAAELKVGIITIKRAYAELEKEALIINVQGKGCFVNKLDISFLKAMSKKQLQEQVNNLLAFCNNNDISQSTLIQMIKQTWRNEE